MADKVYPITANDLAKILFEQKATTEKWEDYPSYHDAYFCRARDILENINIPQVKEQEE